MAIQDANKAVLTIGPTKHGVRRTIGALTSITIDETADIHSARHMTSDRMSHYLSFVSWNMSGEGLYDNRDVGQSAFISGDTVYVSYYPEGNTTGKPVMHGHGILTAFNVSAQMDNAVTVSFALQGQEMMAKRLAAAPPPTGPSSNTAPTMLKIYELTGDSTDLDATNTLIPAGFYAFDPAAKELLKVSLRRGSYKLVSGVSAITITDAYINGALAAKTALVETYTPASQAASNPAFHVYAITAQTGLVDDDGVAVPAGSYAYDFVNMQLIKVEASGNTWQLPAMNDRATHSVVYEAGKLSAISPDANTYQP